MDNENVSLEDEYSFEDFEVVRNRNKYTFKKVYKNGKSFFDEFVDGLTQAPDKAALASIYNLMENFDKDKKLPYSLFHPVKKNDKKDRDDVYEFKKNKVRVYVVLGEDNVIILLGGFKSTQDKDIKKVYRHFNGMTF